MMIMTVTNRKCIIKHNIKTGTLGTAHFILEITLKRIGAKVFFRNMQKYSVLMNTSIFAETSALREKLSK